jgi:dTDP-4-amino-4,6-dideoxygalactose transaminase
MTVYEKPAIDLVTLPLKDQYEPFRQQILDTVSRVLDHGRFIIGPEVEDFEQEVADYLGVQHAIGTSNCTEGMVILLDALGVGPGDEVICPVHTFFATAQAVARRGAKPVFCDIDPATLNLSPEDVRRKVTPKTKAIMAVHLCGRPAPVAELPEGLPVIEDAAQAFGAHIGGVKAGTLGTAASFSFFPGKNLFTFGDGGMVTTNDAELASRVRLLRRHGTRDLRRYEAVGYNARLDAVHAAMLRLFLPHVDRWNEQRREAADRYRELLGDCCELPVDEPGHVYHIFTARTDRAKEALAALAEEGIGISTIFPTPFHLEPVFAGLGYQPGSLPATEASARDDLALPIWPGISEELQKTIAGAVRRGVSA